MKTSNLALKTTVKYWQHTRPSWRK